MARLKRKKTQSEKRKTQAKKTEYSNNVSQQEKKSKASKGPTKDSKKLQILSYKKHITKTKEKRSPAKKNYVHQALQFLREVKAELKKVVWPSFKQTVGSTAVVILLVTLISIFLGLADLGLSSIVRLVLQ